MQNINKVCGMDLSYPKESETLRNTYEQGREKLFSLPGIRVINMSSTFVWASLLTALYFIAKRQWMMLTVLLPVLMQTLILFVSPMNGTNFRYTYPIAVCLPVICMFASTRRET